jgi:hypothetical protein
MVADVHQRVSGFAGVRAAHAPDMIMGMIIWMIMAMIMSMAMIMAMIMAMQTSSRFP